MSQTVWPYRAGSAAGGTHLEFETPFGHRRYSCADPFGQWWSFATVIKS